MGRNTKGTPFPTGLFKSKAFLRKVEEAMAGDGRIPKINTGKPFGPQVVTIVDSRSGRSVAKVVAGGKAGAAKMVCVDGVALPVAGKKKSGLRHRPAWAMTHGFRVKKMRMAKAAAPKR